MKNSRQLNEATIADLALLVDSAFLMQGERAKHVGEPVYDGFNSKQGMFRFRVGSGNPATPSKSYMVRIRFPELNEYISISERSGQTPKADEIMDILLETGDVQVDCQCPSFVYWGYAYILTVLEAAIKPETRFPEVRNPDERGIFCKHCNRVFTELPKHYDRMLKDLEIYLKTKEKP